MTTAITEKKTAIAEKKIVAPIVEKNDIELAEDQMSFFHKGVKFYVDKFDEWRQYHGKNEKCDWSFDDFGSSYEVEYKMSYEDSWHNLGKNFFHKEEARKAIVRFMKEHENVYRIRYIEELNLSL